MKFTLADIIFLYVIAQRSKNNYQQVSKLQVGGVNL